jgi:hypothetical protein
MTLPFKVKSITVENTGFTQDSVEVEGVLSIDDTMIKIVNPVHCVYDTGEGFTEAFYNDEFFWSFGKIDKPYNPYVLIQLK